MGSWQDALHTWILEGWSSRLTDLVAAEIRTSEKVRYCGLMQRYQSPRQAKSLAPSSSSLQRSANTNRVTGSMAAAKPQAERTSLINSTVGTDLGIRGLEVLCSVAPVYHLEKTAARSGSVCSLLLSMARRETCWKAALRSRATSTRVRSASARYCWMVLIMVLAPSGRRTPY